MAGFKKRLGSEKKQLSTLLLQEYESGTEGLTSSKTGIDRAFIARLLDIYNCMKTAALNKEDDITFLIAAVRHGEEFFVSRLLEEGVDPNSGSVHGMNPLSFALHLKSYIIARTLIRNGADVNKYDDAGRAPMYHAIEKDTPISIVQDLLSAGVSPDAVIQAKSRITPLVKAVEEKSITIAQFLLEKSANVNFVTADSKTPLTVAISGGSLELVELLVKHGVNVNGLNKGDVPPLLVAASKEDFNILTMLILSGARFSPAISLPQDLSSSVKDQFAFYIATALCNVDSVRSFLDNGHPDSAIELRHIKMALYFSYSINKKYKRDLRPNNARKKVIELLLSKFDDVNVLFDDPSELISDLISSRNWIALEEFIRCGLNVNSPVNKKNGCSIFHFVILAKLTKLVELCLDFGADFSIPFKGKMPYQLAIDMNQPGIVKAFLKHGHPFDDCSNLFSLHSSHEISLVMVSHAELLKSLSCHSESSPPGVLEYLFSMVAQHVEGRSCSQEIKSPIHFCASHGYPKFIQGFLNLGAPPSTLDSDGLTPLHLAATKGCPHTCRVLLQHGACYNYPCPKGSTPLSLAQGSSQDITAMFNKVYKCFRMVKHGNKNVIRILERLSRNDSTREELSCCINSVNRKGNTLLAEAIARGQTDIAEGIMMIRINLC